MILWERNKKFKNERADRNPDSTAEDRGGSGSSLLSDFLSSQAQVYVSGDLRYHDALNVADAGRGMIDVGHFASEQIMAPALAEQLQEAARKKGLDVEISVCELEKEPFETI